MILTDNETKVDLLNNEAIAATIIDLVRDRPDLPVTIGIHGDWGAGKSSILEMIEDRLSKEPKTLCLKFNGWRFQGFEDAKIALIEGIVTSLVEKRSLWTKATEATKDVYDRIDKLKLAKKAGGLAFTLFTGIPTPDLIATGIAAVEALFDDPTKVVSKENVAKNDILLRPFDIVYAPRSSVSQVGLWVDQNINAVIQHIKGGKLRALAITGDKRSPLLADVPTLAEAGVKGVDVYSWQAVVAPKGLPADIRSKMQEGIVAALNDPQVREQFTAVGFEIVGNTPEAFAAFQQREYARWKHVIDTRKITAD